MYPFVATTSEGGPFDTMAYLAGYELGMIEAFLAVSKPGHLSYSIDALNAAQVDLMAMRQGYIIESSHPDPEHEGNLVVTLHRS